MKFWISGEVDEDIDEAYGEASLEIEEQFDSKLAKKDYGAAVENWDFIGIVLAGGARESGLPEIHRYKKRSKSLEFRLSINHDQFKRASRPKKRRLIFAAVLRSLEIARSFTIRQLDLDKLERDVITIGRASGWLERSGRS